MGSAGSAFISHTKGLSPGAQTKDGGFGSPPHPLRVTGGMCFEARRGGNRRTLQVTRIADGIARCRPTDGGRVATVRCDRLLAAEDGRGLNYRFTGYAKRQSGYQTVARLVAVDSGQALLCLPEWHPRRPVRLFADLLPGDARVGGWLSVRAHLEAARSAHLQVHKLASCEPPDAELAGRAEVEAPAQASAASAPAVGPGCGDIVLYADQQLLERLAAPAAERWDRSVFVSANRPPVSYEEGRDPNGLQADAGIWIAHGERVRHRYALQGTENSPSGTLLFLGDGTADSADGPACQPFVGWRSRWWPLTGTPE